MMQPSNTQTAAPQWLLFLLIALTVSVGAIVTSCGSSTVPLDAAKCADTLKPYKALLAELPIQQTANRNLLDSLNALMADKLTTEQQKALLANVDAKAKYEALVEQHEDLIRQSSLLAIELGEKVQLTEELLAKLKENQLSANLAYKQWADLHGHLQQLRETVALNQSAIEQWKGDFIAYINAADKPTV
jgi:hypothetical protein